MKQLQYSVKDAHYSAPETEVLSLESNQFIAASGNFNTDPWGNGNTNWCG
ncbi:MAG: hypothetical protein IKX03_01680 [Bacteroidales bacterium]|nr:hypothetical protein [Bacteroidales bacterium]